mmetsp:Transcript_11301/g.25336  ORF Transcript_11301/g.25336 Transcript_11301/m.25336 type:complete len:364 (+) Transcript_11301:270-1361(+)
MGKGEERIAVSRSPCSPLSAEAVARADECSQEEDQIAATSLLVSVVKAMIRQEEAVYAYASYRPDDCCTSNGIKEKWRQDICHWTYSVVDHFDLSRETVAISLSLFDRYMAAEGNKCTGETALLTSLTTLFVAVKLNEKKTIHLNTLADLSRRQFTANDIVLWELRVLEALSWKVNPPTHVSFVSHLLQFMPSLHSSVRRDLFELSRYLCELCLCDSHFIDYRPSSVAYASILNVFEHMQTTNASISIEKRKAFTTNLLHLLDLNHNDSEVIAARSRMHAMFASSMDTYAQEGMLLSPSDTAVNNDFVERNDKVSSASASASATKSQHHKLHVQVDCGVSVESHSDGSMSRAKYRHLSPPRTQ